MLPRMMEKAYRRPIDGNKGAPIVWDATALTEPGRDTRVMLSLDLGEHASCWWESPIAYERCWHMSLSHPLVAHDGVTPPERLFRCLPAEVKAWAVLAFGDRYYLEQPLASDDPTVLAGKAFANVTHVRQWIDAHSRPIRPFGRYLSR